MGVMFVILFLRPEYFNHMQSHERYEQYIIYLSLGDTNCVICSKICKSLCGLKRHMVVYENLIKELNQVASTIIIPFVCYLCFKISKSATVKPVV